MGVVDFDGNRDVEGNACDFLFYARVVRQGLQPIDVLCLVPVRRAVYRIDVAGHVSVSSRCFFIPKVRTSCKASGRQVAAQVVRVRKRVADNFVPR